MKLKAYGRSGLVETMRADKSTEKQIRYFRLRHVKHLIRKEKSCVVTLTVR
jgi:oligoribonuclease (3'-5' exoribonuclease)